MKRVLGVLFSNLFLFLFFIFAIEVIIWGCENARIKIQKIGYIGKLPSPFHPGIRYFQLVDFNMFHNDKAGWARKPVGLNYKKGSVVVFGGSYAFGFNLNSEQTFSYKLSHLSKRPVYNRACSGWGIQHMLNQVRQSDFYNDVPEPEYVIYIMINDHFRRLYVSTFMPSEMLLEYQNLRYAYKNGELVQKKINNKFLEFIHKLYLFQKIEHFYINNIILRKNNYKEYFDFALEHFIESRNEMQKHWNNTKYVVLLYNYFPNDELFIKQLKENGFTVVSLCHDYSLPNLSNPEYRQSNFHPTEKAWDLITPQIIGTLNL